MKAIKDPYYETMRNAQIGKASSMADAALDGRMLDPVLSKQMWTKIFLSQMDDLTREAQGQ